MATESDSVPTLYTFSGSGNSYKVRLLQALLRIDIRHEELDFLADQQHSPEFLKINPRGEVPALVDGDRTFSDSSSILVWLAGKYGEGGTATRPSKYWSGGLYEQAQIVDWASSPTAPSSTIADVSVFVYVALAPMGDISLEPWKAVREWIERMKKLPGFFTIEGLDDPLLRRR